MTERHPGNKAHLERLIEHWSRDEATTATAGRLRRLVCVSVLAEMLGGLDDGDAAHLAFKGGASMELRFGPDARSSRDVDALIDIDFDHAFAQVTLRLATRWQGFTGTVGERTEILRVGIVPAPQRCKIKLSYLDRPFGTLDFEVSRAEAGSFVLLETIENSVELERVQLGPAHDVVVLSIAYQIAQKLHACTEIPANGTNARVHDLYDILLLEALARSAGLERTRAACEDTFSHRQRHAWPPALPDWDEWPMLWRNLAIPSDARIPYDEARRDIELLIAAIAAA